MIDKKTIVITGVTKGLGRALTESFIQAGHCVIGCGRSVGAIEEMNGVYPDNPFFNVVDVADPFSVQEWVVNSLDEHGVPDILINNAAIINKNANLWEISAEDFSLLIDINIKGTVNVIRSFLPAMIKQEAGLIINISSTWGRSASPEVAPYCASKFAIEGLTKSLAQELPEGLAAVALNPGVINTEMLRSCLPDLAQSCLTPEQWVRQAVPFILSLGSLDNGKSLTVE